MRIAIGSDHRGYEYKTDIKAAFPAIMWHDVGCHTPERCDYPPFAQEVAQLVASGTVDAGVLLCGSGIGMAMAANRCKGVYAGVVWNKEIARVAKEDDNINILVVPADFISVQQAIICMQEWLSVQFKGGRYQQRLRLIDC